MALYHVIGEQGFCDFMCGLPLGYIYYCHPCAMNILNVCLSTRLVTRTCIVSIVTSTLGVWRQLNWQLWMCWTKPWNTVGTAWWVRGSQHSMCTHTLTCAGLLVCVFMKHLTDSLIMLTIHITCMSSVMDVLDINVSIYSVVHLSTFCLGSSDMTYSVLTKLW